MQPLIGAASADNGGAHREGDTDNCGEAASKKEPKLRGYPQSQTRTVMQEKELLANRLLRHGLTVRQICSQLRCSPAFVRKVRVAMEESGEGRELAIPTMAQSMR